ncbi:MAG TPA: BrnT family toxin [Acidisphaera sp.]|nr:BrnT family toxin [Acidisphaera sp.]
MEFEWDEAKCLANISKHGFDFVRAVTLFDDPHLVEPARSVSGEDRWLAIGMAQGSLVTVVFTRRATKVRIISMRRARRGESQRYQAVYGR